VDASLLHSLVTIVFIALLIGAAIVFRRAPGGARRDPRAALISLLFWGFVWTTYWPQRSSPPSLVVVGIALLVSSLALFVWAAHSIRGKMFSYAYTRDTPEFLHTGGPYAYVRNPFYDSYLLATVGSLLMWPTWVGAAVTVAMVAYFISLAKFEEQKFEASPLRAEYDRYRARTGRLLPRVRGGRL
jgi:protein-S-isoprenylcysteine O-methyltransferase Ste14